MKLSHSKLSTILTCPATYYLKYIEEISLICEKPALAIGSAVHWGIEHNTEDLSEYYHSEESEYTRDQLLSEAMVHGYLKHKDDIFRKVLSYEGETLNLVEESHELYLSSEIPSNKFEKPHDFVGIIDLLLLTDKGFIILDYKTSSSEPDWNNYKDQLYRYITLVQSQFPEIPILKIGIINLRKTSIRQKKGENYLQFLNRLRFEYEVNDESYIVYHEFDMKDIEEKFVEEYRQNLSLMSDLAEIIDQQKLFFINYGAANGIYGKSPYWEIFYKIPDAHLLYKIKDRVMTPEGIEETRFCNQFDMLVLEKKVLNHYEIFEEKYKHFLELNKEGSFEEFLEKMKKEYVFDEALIKNYKEVFEKS